MKVLVTGGSGWIGQATTRALEVRGHEPIAYDRSDGFDILEAASVDDAVADVDHVIHLAGVLGTHELFSHPEEAVDVNVRGALNVTIACLRGDVSLTEITMPRVNPSLYSATKGCAMDIALAFQEAEGLRCSFVRAYNAYGPGQAYGGDHPQKIVPTFATKAWAGEPLPVWGEGDLWVDLVHVDDVARVLVEAMAFTHGEVFDAGTAHRQTVVEVADQVIAITGGPSVVKHLDPRKGERRQRTENDVAKGEGWELLNGWRPVFDPERLAEAVESYRP